MKKRISAAVLAAALLLSLAACGGKPAPGSSSGTPGELPTATDTAAPPTSTDAAVSDTSGSTAAGGSGTKAPIAARTTRPSGSTGTAAQPTNGTTTAQTTKTTTPFTPKPEDKTMIWMSPKSIDYSTGTVMSDFVSGLTNTANWPTLLKHTRVLKLYIQQIYTTPASELKKLGRFVQENNLLVAVELGGIRVAPRTTERSKIGVTAAASEYQNLLAFIERGGRVDYITTDHALAANITGRTEDFPGMTMQQYMEQQAEYYRYMQNKLPGLKVGAIESLGFFWVKGKDRQYQATDGSLSRVDFETYLSELFRICKGRGVTLDHFHIDFGYHDVLYDGDYGRILAVEDYTHSLGMNSGFIAANAFHKNMDYPAKDEAEADRSAYERTLAYFEGYVQAGGRSDYLLFQRWQHYPIGLGSEGEKYSNFGIFKAMLDSPAFPKK